MIGIRVDANDKIAIGHVMRCMSIASELKKQNNDVIFIVSEESAKKIIVNNGYECICLNNKYNEKNSEILQMHNIIKKYNINKLLLDSYEVTPEYMKKLKKDVKLIYIDDINKFKYPADIIVNYTYKTDMSIYEERQYTDEIFLLGSKYIPLRSEFAAQPISINKKVENIFITTGGTDNLDMITGILKKLSYRTDIDKIVVTGRFYKHLDYLNDMAVSDSSIKVYNNISNICDVMKKCDIAISAGGTTLAELCACGIPTICFSIADNQLYGTEAYSNDGLMLYAGDARVQKDVVIRRISDNLELLIKDYSFRQKIACKQKKIIDGKGSFRIAREIIKL